MGNLSGKFRNQFLKSWSSIYSTEMFSNGFRNMEMDMGAKGVGSFIKKWHYV
jgi:hypothetical protein